MVAAVAIPKMASKVYAAGDNASDAAAQRSAVDSKHHDDGLVPLAMPDILVHGLRRWLCLTSPQRLRMTVRLTFGVVCAVWIWPGICLYGGIVQAAMIDRYNILSAFLVGFVAFASIGYGIDIMVPFMASKDGLQFNALGNGQLVSKKMAKGFANVWKMSLAIDGVMFISFQSLNFLSFYALVSGALTEKAEPDLLLPAPELATPAGVTMIIAHVAFVMMVNLTAVYLAYLLCTIALATTSMKDSLLRIMRNIKELPPYNIEDAGAEFGEQFNSGVVDKIRTFALDQLPQVEHVFEKTIASFTATLFMWGYVFIIYAIDGRFVQRAALILIPGHNMEMRNVAETAVHITFLGSSLAFFFLPFLLVTSLASVTTCCHDIRDALNNLRIRDPTGHVDKKILALERFIDNMHNGDGMGFKLFGKLISTSSVRILLYKVCIVVILGVPYVMKLKGDR